tara:strand:- start:1020 stop:1187 length:168 start_codon:yes stop_codon:yes gene_type:complete
MLICPQGVRESCPNPLLAGQHVMPFCRKTRMNTSPTTTTGVRGPLLPREVLPSSG